MRGAGDGSGNREAEVLEPVELALEVHPLARRGHPDDLHRLPHLLDGRRERQPVPLPHDDLARQPEAEREAARGQVPERRRGLPVHDRRARLHRDHPVGDPERRVWVAINVDSTMASAPEASPTQAVR